MDTMTAIYADEQKKLMNKIDRQQQIIIQMNGKIYGLRTIHEKNKNFLGLIDTRRKETLYVHVQFRIMKVHLIFFSLLFL